MKFQSKIFVALGAAVALTASTSSFAQLGLPKLGGTSTNAQANVDASASQDQLVKSYIIADSEAMLGQSKMAEALGLKDKAADAAAKVDALKSGATMTAETIKEANQTRSDVSEALTKAQAENVTLSDEAKAKFGEGLGHLGLGLLGTVKLKDAAMNFQQSAQAQITSASLLDKLSVTRKLAAGTYVATNLPGHIINVGSGLKSAVSFAQSHNIPVPADATAALSALPSQP